MSQFTLIRGVINMPLKPIVVTSVSPDFVEFDEDDEDDEEELQSIGEWVREYAAYAGPKLLHPTLEMVKDAIRDDFPELATLDLDQLLEEIGIHVIADYGNYRIAWFGTTNAEEVDDLLANFQQENYSRIRESLGVTYLWILNLSPKLGYMRNDIFEADIQFSLIEEKPECAIIDL